MMKSLLQILTALVLVAGFSSCKKSKEDTSPQVTVIKYQVSTSVPLKDTSANAITIQYVNGAGQTITVNDFTAGMSSWTKTDTVTTGVRPLNLSLSSPSDFFLTGFGSVSGTIFINGVPQSYNSTTAFVSGGVYRGFLSTLTAVVN